MVLSITLSFIGEGNTDYRFFPNIAERIIQQLLIENNKEALIKWQVIEKTGESSAEVILNAAIQAKYCTTLIVHSDADNISHDNALQNKIQPGLNAIANHKYACCKNITVVVPITETEAWMLVDKDLLKEEMNTTLSDHDLGLTYQLSKIETIADPKQRIEDAIHAHHRSLPSRRRKHAVKIGELYEPMSQQIELGKLEILESYKSFKSSLIHSLRVANILNSE